MTVPRGAWPRALAIATLAAALYAGSLGNDLVWDDRLTAAAPVLGPQPGQWWRPVVMATFAGEHVLAGGAAWAMHLFNLAVHAAVAVLLDRLALALGLASGVALVAALGFAAHPVQTEAVAYVSGRTDLLCALFVLLALLAWRRAQGTWDRWAWATAGLVLLALGAKEAAALVPLVLLLPGTHPASRPPRPVLPIVAAGTWSAWFVVRSVGRAGPIAGVGALVGRIPAMAALVVDYARVLVWPWGLHLERFVPVSGWSSPRTIGTVALALAIGAGLLLAARATTRGGPVLLALAVATYLPVAGVVPVYPAIADRALFGAEHFLYLPLLGLAPLLAATAARAWPARLVRAEPAVIALVLAVWGAATVVRVRDWRDEETLFRHTLRYDPPAARVWYNLGNLRLAAGDPAEAARLYEAALAREPGDASAHLNLGIALQRLGRRDEAMRHYEEALRLDPSLVRAFQPPAR